MLLSMLAGNADVVVTILNDRDGYEICFVEDAAFYDLATPKFDVVDFAARAKRGGDGNAPPAAAAIEHSHSVASLEDVDATQNILQSESRLVVLDFNAGVCIY
jgi:hypothetical protein